MVEHWPWCWYTVLGELMGSQPGHDEWAGRRHLGRPHAMSTPMGGVWPTVVGILLYRGPLWTFFCTRFPPLSAAFGYILVSFFLYPFQDEHGAIILGGARWGCSACNILCYFLWGVNFPVSQRLRSRDNSPYPHPPIGEHSGMSARQRRSI